MKKIIILTFGFMFLALSFSYASSLSDRNIKGFQERVSPPIRAAENPFLKQNVSPQDLLAEDLHLSGIVHNANEAYALISGYMVKEGEDIAGFRVKVVEKDHVVLRQLDQVKVLRLE